MKNASLYAPFIALALLFPINFAGNTLIYPRVGIEGSTVADVIISIGLFIGIVGIFFSQQLTWYWRLAIGFSFLPVIATSYTISGLCCA